MEITLAHFRSSDWVAHRLLSFHAFRLIRKKKSVHVRTTTKVWVPERIKNRKHLQRVTSQNVIAKLPLSSIPLCSGREVTFTSGRHHQFTWVGPYFSPKNFLQKSAASALVILKLSPWKCPPGKMALISASMWLKISESFVRFRLQRGEKKEHIECIFKQMQNQMFLFTVYLILFS